MTTRRLFLKTAIGGTAALILPAPLLTDAQEISKRYWQLDRSQLKRKSGQALIRVTWPNGTSSYYVCQEGGDDLSKVLSPHGITASRVLDLDRGIYRLVGESTAIILVA